MKNIWYEIAFSYKNDGGTETIETSDTLEGAKVIVDDLFGMKRASTLKDVDIVFIDRWYCENDGSGGKDRSFEPIIYKTKDIEIVFSDDDEEYELHDRGSNNHLNEISGLIEDFVKTKDLHPPKDVIIQHFIEWFTSDDDERNVMIQAMQYYLKEGIDKEIE